MDPVFVSGANGYIGGAILRALLGAGIPALAGTRGPAPLPAGVMPVITGELATATVALGNAGTVIHAAGLGHRRGLGPKIWRAANVDAAVNLARQAKAAGVSRFILISTAYIHGRVHDGIVTDDTPPNPMDDYAASKLVAERAVAAEFGAGLSIIRPVAVIGPACPGNVQLLLKLLWRGIPLPFGAIVNQRTFIAADDLARLVLVVLRAATPPRQLLAAHPGAVSTPELIRALAAGMARPPRLFPCPPALLGLTASALGRAAMWQSLAGNFSADPRAGRALGWAPAQTLAETLVETARYYNTTTIAA